MNHIVDYPPHCGPEPQVVVPLGPALSSVVSERVAQEVKWGEQNHADGTGVSAAWAADAYRERCERAFAEGRGTWRDILLEEVFEALAEEDPAPLREELVQVAAVAIAWVEAIDRRTEAAEGERA